MHDNRKVIHIDMDAFFASVEQLDNPKLRGQPVVVGGKPNSRGVVAAASYEARKFGVHSAMPCSQAYRLCRQAIFVSPRFNRYREISQQVMDILEQYSSRIEVVSIDEAYVDISGFNKGFIFARDVAENMRSRILSQTGLTASAGVAPNKFLAKLASEMQKPNGLTVIEPERVAKILEALPVRKLHGIGRVTEARMAELGIHTTRDLRAWGEQKLSEAFGKAGAWYFRIAHGIDLREVQTEHIRKSVGIEDTFAEDSLSLSFLVEQLKSLTDGLIRRLKGQAGRTLTLKATYAGFQKVSRSLTSEAPFLERERIIKEAKSLLLTTEAGSRPIRLLGLTVSNFDFDQSTPTTPQKHSDQFRRVEQLLLEFK